MSTIRSISTVLLASIEIDGEAVTDKRFLILIAASCLLLAEKSLNLYLSLFGKRIKIKISHSQRKIVFRYANEEEKRQLILVSYDMVVNVTSTTYLADGRPFQYGEY